MLSGKVEKRIASSVYITLAPPRRDTVIQGGVKPEVHQPSSDHPKEATKSDGTHQPHVSPPQKLSNSSRQAGKQSSGTLGSAGHPSGVAGLSNGGKMNAVDRLQCSAVCSYSKLHRACEGFRGRVGRH